MSKDLQSWLEDKIVQARDDQQTSQRVAQGSYGNGYACGELRALQEVWEFMEFELETEKDSSP
jgi:hypothetical protein